MIAPGFINEDRTVTGDVEAKRHLDGRKEHGGTAGLHDLSVRGDFLRQCPGTLVLFLYDQDTLLRSDIFLLLTVHGERIA